MANMHDLITMGRATIDLYSQDIGVPFEKIKSFAAYVGGSPTNIAVGAERQSHCRDRVRHGKGLSYFVWAHEAHGHHGIWRAMLQGWLSSLVTPSREAPDNEFGGRKEGNGY